MEKVQFLKMCNEILTLRGFVKKRKNYYLLNGIDLQCVISIYKSYYSSEYLIDVFLFIGDSDKHSKVPEMSDYDLYRRVSIPEKKSTMSQSRTCYIDYELFEEEELKPYIELDIDSEVMPALVYGKGFLLESNKIGYGDELYLQNPRKREENIIDKLKE